MIIYNAICREHRALIESSRSPKEQVVSRVLFKLFSSEKPTQIPITPFEGVCTVKIQYFPELYQMLSDWCVKFEVGKHDILHYACELYLKDAIVDICQQRLRWPPKLKKVKSQGFVVGLIYMD